MTDPHQGNPHRDEEPKVLDPVEARQALPGRPVFTVLKVSLTLAILVGIVLVAWFWQQTPGA
jgi:hypothetical protein